MTTRGTHTHGADFSAHSNDWKMRQAPDKKNLVANYLKSLQKGEKPRKRNDSRKERKRRGLGGVDQLNEPKQQPNKPQERT